MFFLKQSKERRLCLLCYGGIFAFILAVNLLMLPVADEWAQWPGRPAPGSIVDFVYSHYLNWNARLGELLFRVFMFSAGNTLFQQQLIFGAVNTFIFCGFLANLFYLVRGHYPRAQKKDALLVVFLFTALYYGSFFNEAFIWQSGAMNYGWALFFASCWALPYRRYLAAATNPPKNYDKFLFSKYLSAKEILMALGFFMVSIPVGMGGEILSPCLCFGLFLLLCHEIFIQKRIPPLWFFAGGLGIFAGWLLLITAPGPNNRKQVVLSSDPNFMKFSFRRIFSGVLHLLSSPKIFSFMPLLFLECLVLLKKGPRNWNNSSFLIPALLAVGLLGLAMGAFVGIPSRTYITFTVFFVTASAFLFDSHLIQGWGNVWLWAAGLIFLLLFKVSPLEPHVRTILILGFALYLALFFWRHKFFTILNPLIVFLFLGTIVYNAEAYISFHGYLKGHFSEIQRQKDSGIQEIKIPALHTPLYKGVITMLYFMRADWVLNPLARYYKVKSIDFINPDSGESYRDPNA